MMDQSMLSNIIPKKTRTMLRTMSLFSTKTPAMQMGHEANRQPPQMMGSIQLIFGRNL